MSMPDIWMYAKKIQSCHLFVCVQACIPLLIRQQIRCSQPAIDVCEQTLLVEPGSAWQSRRLSIVAHSGRRVVYRLFLSLSLSLSEGISQKKKKKVLFEAKAKIAGFQKKNPVLIAHQVAALPQQ